VVAIVGQQATTALGGDYQQEVDLISLYKDVARDYVHMCATPTAARHQIDRALRIAIAERTVTCVIFPNDVQELRYQEPPRKHGSIFTGPGYRFPVVVPQERDLDRAADVLNAGEKVAMLIGAGALFCPDEVMATAERLGAGVAKALLGRAALPDDLPYVTGSIGLLGTRPSWDMMTECDTLLMVGTSFPYSEFLPKEGKARCVQIDIKPRNLSLRYPAEVPLHGDAGPTLRALLPRLKAREDRAWRERIEGWVSEWWKVMEARAMNSADPINPQRVFWEASARLPDGCVLAADSGSSACWFARDLRVRRGMLASLSGNLATMCPGVPYVIAAKFAYPDRVAIGFIGDGAMQMLGINGLITVSRHWREWSDPRLILCVLNNGDLNQVTWEQRVLAGDPKFEASQDLPEFPYAEYARDLGLTGERIDDPDAIGGAWDRALAADRPAVLEFVTDPDVPPLPPHITLEQAKAYLSSMVKGDPDRMGMARQSFKDLVEAYLPHGGDGRREHQRVHGR
jgi:pyruvate dehydrogenase (quinone)